jgi:hypothetical protein
MGKSKREFIMEELMEPGFIEIGGRMLAAYPVCT